MPAPAASPTPSHTPEAEPTIRALLARRELSLSLAVDEADLDAEALDTPLRWVHSSDLADPTPFLADDLLLLTTGTQFVPSAGGDDSPAAYERYVARLHARGVRGLGFGTEVVRDGIPPGLVDACRAARLPLFEVPYRTPFIALARANAEAIAAQAYARRTWALSAQRAISLAALRPDGLAATVSELARQLGASVGLYDAAGALVHGDADLAPQLRAALDAEAGAVLRRGARAASQFEVDGVRVTLQTLGRGGHLRGLLAVAGADLDLEARSVVTSVVAMTGLALEQGMGLARGRAALRAGLVSALLGGDAALARHVGREVWGPLPTAPVVVAVAQVGAGRTDAATDWLEVRAAEARGTLFHGRGPAGHVLVVPAGAQDAIDAFAALFDAPTGVSDPTDYATFATAHEQAVVAGRRAAGPSATAGAPGSTATGTAVRFADAATGGVLSALDSAPARALAAARLAPLRAHDAAHGTALVATVRTWLEHDARIDEAARALGIHRHTVRTRVALAQQVLGLDLASFPARAELWAAFVAAG
ncbi:PucR family transcriptional regulator ligand-binding domain-containing protein [Microbacterium sp. bgisy203]|uniref:helix-turn-helix domain-containing protein n=1 Tax=Microbacterium sp. bgisy203 TaxID=3413799 RepID=UPI003D72A64F